MKSPYTGKEMRSIYEQDTWRFRNEEFKCYRLFWYDDTVGERFTTSEEDDAAYLQVTNQYREKYGIPYTDEIIALRKRYKVSAAKMAKLLGLGTNQYRMYENGEVPNLSNGKLIKSAMNPKIMLDFLRDAKQILTDTDYRKIEERLKKIIDNNSQYEVLLYEKKRLYSSERGIANGFGELSLERLKKIIIYILNNCETVWVTKLNKILFYLDFCAYRNFGQAMTGLSYRAIDYGPVPDKWEKVYSEFDEVQQIPKQIDKCSGNIIKTDTIIKDLSCLFEKEQELLKYICQNLGKKSATALSKLSHEEDVWKRHCATHSLIPFQEAFFIKAL